VPVDGLGLLLPTALDRARQGRLAAAAQAREPDENSSRVGRFSASKR
jgi:hypothetical protein